MGQKDSSHQMSDRSRSSIWPDGSDGTDESEMSDWLGDSFKQRP